MRRVPLRIGHRGAPKELPANTMLSFKRAFELGCEMVECDVRASLDGKLVLAHDPSVIDVNGRTYVIAETLADTLNRLDLGAGEGVPLLAELVDWAKVGCGIMADLKVEGSGIEARLCEELAPLPPEQKVVPGASWNSRELMRSIDPTLPLSRTSSWTEVTILSGDVDLFISELDTPAVTWHHSLVSAERVRALQRAEIRVYVWTVDGEPTMLALSEIGVDGIITNRPDLLTAMVPADASRI